MAEEHIRVLDPSDESSGSSVGPVPFAELAALARRRAQDLAEVVRTVGGGVTGSAFGSAVERMSEEACALLDRLAEIEHEARGLVEKLTAVRTCPSAPAAIAPPEPTRTSPTAVAPTGLSVAQKDEIIFRMLVARHAGDAARVAERARILEEFSTTGLTPKMLAGMIAGVSREPRRSLFIRRTLDRTAELLRAGKERDLICFLPASSDSRPPADAPRA